MSFFFAECLGSALVIGWEKPGVEHLLPTLRGATGQDASWTSLRRGVSGMPRRPQGTLERLYISTGLGTSLCPLRGVYGSSQGEERLDLPYQTVVL